MSASRIDALVPRAVRAICERLQAAGHEALAVGGAVRDALLGRTPGDWDVATSATPEQVIALFDRTVPTGIKHGTVTVLMGRGTERMAVEVTTFRGEGAYSDGRRPDEVVFGVPLRDDLARRDFVINAIAYDPVARILADPFGGEADIAARRIRAVGDPLQRFTEDGLRVMRAVRFAAVLEFELDPATMAAIPPALPVLAMVSSERVRDELLKLLGARAPSIGLVIARRAGILDAILPELDFGPDGADGPDDRAARHGSEPAREPGDHSARESRWQRALVRVDQPAGVLVRLAGLLAEPGRPLPPLKDPTHPLRRLKLANAEIEAAGKLLEHGPAWASGVADNMDSAAELDDTALRRLLGRVGRTHAPALIASWQAERQARAGDPAATRRLGSIIGRARHILDAGHALTVGELAMSGGELMSTLHIPPGPQVGELLTALLGHVLADPAKNTLDTLRALAAELARKPA